MQVAIIYTTDPCARCVNAKALLERRGIAYEEVNLAKDPDGRDELMKCTGMLTFPQIRIGDHMIGGFEDLLAADKNGRLKQLAAEPPQLASEPAEQPAGEPV
jgi:glutaredoxin 3